MSEPPRGFHPHDTDAVDLGSEHEFGQRPDERVEAVRAPGRDARLPLAHLILEQREHAHVVDAPLLVETRDRLSTYRLAARCPHLFERDVPIDRLDVRLDEVATVVYLANDAVSLERAVQRDRALAPLLRRGLDDRPISEHVSVPILPERGRHDAGLRLLGFARGRRVDADDDAHELWRLVDPKVVDHRLALPQRARRVVEHLRVELLPAEARALVLPQDVAQPLRRDVADVLVGAALGDAAEWIGEQLLDDLRRARRRRDYRARVASEAQP